MTDYQPGEIVRKAKGLEKEESLVIKPMPTTLKDVVSLLAAFDVLRKKHPESGPEIDNIKGGVIQLAKYLSNARLIISSGMQKATVQRTPQQGDPE